jgi:phage terminase large subunit GpA-like protein
MVADWMEAQGNPKLLKVFLNHQLAEPWKEDDVIEQDHEYLYKNRREEYEQDEDGRQLVPTGVAVITAGVDVQHDRFELEILGHGLNGEKWNLGYHRLPCDTSIQSNYDKHLSPFMLQTFPLANGLRLRIVAMAIDSGDGARTQEVYKFCQPRFDSGIYAIKGRGGAGIPIACNPTNQKINGLINQGEEITVKLFMVGTDTAKSSIFASLKRNTVGPGYQHFPNERNLNYFEMLTAERGVLKKKNNKMVRVFEPIRTRNEALDCRVYAMAALEICGADIEKCLQTIETALIEKKQNNPRSSKKKKSGLKTISKGIK